MKREMVVTVENRNGAGCRQELASSIETSLLCGGARISRGHYRVTIERLSDAEYRKLLNEEMAAEERERQEV